MAKFILNDDGSFTQEKKRKKQTSKYEELKNVPFTGQSKFKNQTSGTYFKKSKGNAGQAIGYSALDALGNITEGFLRGYEGISDWGRNRGADIVDFFGADEYAKELRERSKQDDTADIVKQWNHITSGDLAGTKSEEEIGNFKKVKENTVFGDKSGQVFQGIGNSLASTTAGLASGGTLATPSFFMSASGNSEVEALNNGATVGEARLYGALSGTIEAGSERLFGGLGKLSEKFGLGKGVLDDQVTRLLTKNMKSSLMKNITTLGIKSVGEGLEEVAAGFGNALAQKLTYMKDEEIGQLIKDQNLMDSFVNGMLSSALMQSPSTITYTAQGRDVNTGLTRTQQQYVNEIAQQRMVEAQKRNARLNGMQKSQIEDRALTDYQQGRLADANKLQQVNLPGLSTKDMDLQQSAYKYGFNPNSEAIVTAKTMLDNRSIESRFDAEAFKGSNENSFWTKKADGTREVVFNPNASEQTILEEIAIHELTHDLMSSKNSKDIINNQNIMNYVSKLKGYKEARANVEELYAEKTKGMTAQQKAEYINEEIVADTLGKNIGSQEYIRRLIDDEPSIAKNIYDWVVNKVANKNGVKNEKAYWNNVKNNFEKAYNMEYQGKGSDTRHSFMSEKGLANAIKEDKGNQVLANKLARAKELQKQGYSNEQIRQRTLWFQDPNGKWLFEIADLNSDFIVPLKEGMSKNVEELFKHDDLFEAYPQLKKNKIKVKPIKPGKNGNIYGGEANPFTGTITLNSEILKQKNGEKKLRKVLLHELQHQIQFIEGLEKGDGGKNVIRYYSSLGEIQSTEVEDRSKMTPKELKQYPPEVSKQYPIHPYLKDAHNKPNSKFAKEFLSDPKVAELYNEIYNNGIEGEYDRAKINRLGTTKNVSADRNVSLLRGRGQTNSNAKSTYQRERETTQETIEGTKETKTKELDNSSFFNGETRYSLSEETSIEDKINSSMTMAEAKKMIQIAFQENRINDWREDNEKYIDGDDWLNDVGVDEVASYIDNTHSTIINYTNPLYDKNIGFGEDYYTESILEAYQNGTLKGAPKEQATRLDTSISNDYQDDRFYSPREVQATLELYDKANQRVTKSNSEEVYKARADFIIATHQKGVAEQLGLTQQEVNKKVKSWANYTDKARNLSNQLNENVSLQNRWSGLENSSIVNTISVTNEDLSKMVKEIKGDSREWQRQYITSTMLALDTHIDYSKLTFEFDQHQALRQEGALGDYNRRTKTIRIGDGYQNTVAHEIGHYLDNKWAEDFGFLETSNLTDNLNFDSIKTTDEVRQFNKNFQTFMNDLVKSATLGYGKKTNYYQSRSETFARFVGKFVEWTKNQATNNRYGYESKYYEDNFTESQYREFVKILQEKALLDTTMNAEQKHSQQTEGWQSFLDKNFKPKGTKTRLSDIKLPGLTNTIQEEVQKPVTPKAPKVTKPVKNENLPLRKETAVLKLDANQIADALNGNTKEKIQVPGGKKLRRWSETSTKSDVLKDFIGINELDINKITYVPISNRKTLENADNKLSNMSYEEGIEYIKGQLTSGQASLTDIAIAEKLIVEARNRQDTVMVADLLMDVSILSTELGQKVQALSIIQKMTPEGQLKMYQKILTRAKSKGTKGFENVEITPDMVKTILDAYDKNGNYNQDDLNNRVEVFKQQIAEQMTSTLGEKANEWRYLSMLGNPKTHIRNVVSNVAMKGTLSVKNAIARTIEMALPQAKRTKTWEQASSYVKGFAEQTAEEWKGIISGESKYSETQQLNKMKKTFKSETLNKLSNFNSKLLEVEDWFFSKSAFKNSLQEYLTAQGIKTEQDIANNSEIVEKAKMHALEQAQIATFRQYSWLANKINEIENKNKATKVLVGAVMPFKKTPINVAKAGISYSPLGLIKTMTYDLVQLKNGNMEASQFIDNLSQGLTGTSLTLLGYALASAGFITGGSDDDKEGKYDYALGNQTYALKIGNNTYSISWLSPVAMPLLVGANAFSELEEKEEWDANVLINTLASTLDPISEMSFISSLTDVLQSYQQGSMQMISNMGQSAFSSYVTQYFPTLFSQIASVFDNKKRSTRASGDSKFKYGEELWNQIRYKIPGLRNTLPVATDIWGNEQKQADSMVQRAFETFIAPYNRKSVSNTALDKEIKRLYSETGDTEVIPGTPKGYIQYKDERYDMNNAEYVAYKKTYGTKANSYLNSLIATDAYKSATDEEKSKMVQEIYGYAGAYAKKDFFSNREVEYSSDEIKAINKFEELKMNSNDIGEFVAINKLSSTIKSNKDLDASEKRTKTGELMLNANLKDNQLAYLYSKYYSSEEKLDTMLTMKIPMKQFIKFDVADIQGKYNSKTGKTINGSKKNATIEYVNGLNLSKAQKAILIKDAYNTYDRYNNDIIRYVNNLSGTANDKKVLLKTIGFDNYDRDVVKYIKSQNLTQEETEKKLKDLGFTVRDGRVYY